jgi:vitamin B12 transport system permease protein
VALGLVCAVLFGLSAGAAWTVATFMLRHPAPWLALPIGWVLGMCLRHWGAGGQAVRALSAAVAAVLAATYASCLLVWAELAGAMGIGFLAAMKDAGPAMSLYLARLGQTPASWLFGLAGVAVAAAVAWRQGAPGRPVSRPWPLFR